MASKNNSPNSKEKEEPQGVYSKLPESVIHEQDRNRQHRGSQAAVDLLEEQLNITQDTRDRKNTERLQPKL